MPVKQVWEKIMVLEHAWRMFQGGGEQEDASALQCPTVPMLAELGIIQQAVPLFVLCPTHPCLQQGAEMRVRQCLTLSLLFLPSLISVPSGHHPGFL